MVQWHGLVISAFASRVRYDPPLRLSKPTDVPVWIHHMRRWVSREGAVGKQNKRKRDREEKSKVRAPHT